MASESSAVFGPHSAERRRKPQKPSQPIGVLERLACPLGEAGEAVVGERLEQGLLGREVAVDRARRRRPPRGRCRRSARRGRRRRSCARAAVEDPLAIAPRVGALGWLGLRRRPADGSWWVKHAIRLFCESSCCVMTSTQTEPRFRIVLESKPELSFRLSHRHRSHQRGGRADDDHSPGVRAPTLDRPRAALLRAVHRRSRRVDRQRRAAVDRRGARLLAGRTCPGS